MAVSYTKNGQMIKDGRFQPKSQEEKLEEINKRREEGRKESGFPKDVINDPERMVDEHNEVMRKYGKINTDEKTAFTKDFWLFMGFGVPRDYRWGLTDKIKNKVEDMLRNRFPLKIGNEKLVKDYANFYTPIDNMYGTAQGNDLWYEHGRIPMSHLNCLASKRIGVGLAICNRPPRDVFDNEYDIVKESDPEGDPLTTEDKVVAKLKRLDKNTEFNGKLIETFDFANRCGLGHTVVDEYEKEPHDTEKWEDGLRWSIVSPKTDPVKISTFTAEYMSPINAYDTNYLDYNRDKWKFRGGMFGREIHHSRVYTLELYREEIGLRGLSIMEPCFVSLMCYLNMSYYLLRGLSKLGTSKLTIQSQNLIPTKKEVEGYMESGQLMKANDIIVLGAGAQLLVENTAQKIGGGVKEIMDFYKEDICACTCFPQNQLFGRAQGGGLEGAGAIVSKEDYLGSNLSPMMQIASVKVPIMLRKLCNIDLGDRIIRFNIDAHKTEEQRLTEVLMRQQVKQGEFATEQMEMAQPLFKKQMKLQKEMADVQMKMFKADPEGFMQESEKDEENIEEKSPEQVKKDFINYKKQLQWRYDMLLAEYNRNNELIRDINRYGTHVMNVMDRNEKALRIRREREKKYEKYD